MKRGIRAAALAFFALYCLVMLWLLFIRGRFVQQLSLASFSGEYWKWVGWSVNLTPFHTISEFLATLASRDDYLARHAFVNLAGNVVMFLPLGVFLPLLFGKLRRYWRFLLVCALAIVLIEAAQALLLVGSADVDDLILNLCGASLGFPLGALAVKLLEKGDRET